MSDLKPCPFCGGEVKLCADGITVIVCTDCGISLNNGERSIIKLKGQWNTRTIVHHPIEGLIGEVENGDRAVFTRSEVLTLLRSKL